MKSIATLLFPLAIAATGYAQNTPWPASGNVGIGTTSPWDKLDVTGGSIYVHHTTPFLDLYQAGTQEWKIGQLTAGSGDLTMYAAGQGNPSILTLQAGGNVGIGTTNPNARFEVQFSGDDRVVINQTVNANYGYRWSYNGGRHWDAYVNGSSGDLHCYSQTAGDTIVIAQNTGNVGIGTTNPGARLEIMGDISLPSGSGNKQIYTWSPCDTNWRIGMSASPGFTRDMATAHVEYLTYSTGPGQGFAVGVNGGYSSFEIVGFDHKAFFRGNVGIGTTNPTEKLSVNGKIRAKEVIVETAGWSDNVFAKGYHLASLSEVEQHIQQQGHLPGVPSAQEVAEKGVSIGDMQALLLAKIEELTLHQIAQAKHQQAQDERIAALEAENTHLKSQLK